MNTEDNRYAEIDHHPDMLYELVMWETINGNDGLRYGIHWLDDNGDIVDAEWFETDEKRFAEVNKTNEQLKENI